MFYAIIQLCSLQYVIQNNYTFFVNKINLNLGQYLFINNILLFNILNVIFIGKPYLYGSIVAQILEHRLGPKLISFKMKSKKRNRRKIGYRQKMTKIKIFNFNNNNNYANKK